MELDLEQYLVPIPTSASSGAVYAANLTETPRYLHQTSVFSKNAASNSDSHGPTDAIAGHVDQVSSKKVRASILCALFKRTNNLLMNLSYGVQQKT